MPSLPKNNNLEYNPNSDFYASKQLKKIALQNMKDPLKDIDIKVLSKMDAQKNLKSSLEEFQLMYTDVQNDLIKLSQYANSTILKGAGGPGSGRPPGAKNRPKSASAFTSIAAPIGVRQTPSVGSPSVGPPLGTPTAGSPVPLFNPIINTPPGTPSGSSSSSSSAASSPAATPYSFGSLFGPPSTGRRAATPGLPGTPGGVTRTFIAEPRITTILSNLLVSLINKLQKMDMLVVSKIKPAVKKLDAEQQFLIGNILKAIFKIYPDNFQTLLRPGVDPSTPHASLEGYIENSISNGDEILELLKRTLDKLIVNLTICLNAAKQLSTKEGQTTISTEPEEDYVLELTGFVGAGRQQCSGGGRNFYGQVINNSNDIPSIRKSYQNNPTKYLL
jgi:hypothetical protein